MPVYVTNGALRNGELRQWWLMTSRLFLSVTTYL